MFNNINMQRDDEMQWDPETWLKELKKDTKTDERNPTLGH